jgi:hypothetical protein
MGSISGAFTLAAFIVGLFCTRFKMAALAGALPAFLYAALVVIGLWAPSPMPIFFPLRLAHRGLPCDRPGRDYRFLS